MSAVMKKHPDVLWFVDAVSSLGGMKIEVDKLGIDFCLASSQKAIALPPGLAVASVSARCYKKAETVSGRGYYFDILELKNGFTMFSEEGHHSDTISCMVNTKNADFKAIKKGMASKGYSIDSGYTKMNEKLEQEGKPTTFRIAQDRKSV